MVNVWVVYVVNKHIHTQTPRHIYTTTVTYLSGREVRAASERRNG